MNDPELVRNIIYGIIIFNFVVVGLLTLALGRLDK